LGFKRFYETQTNSFFKKTLFFNNPRSFSPTIHIDFLLLAKISPNFDLKSMVLPYPEDFSWKK
jgi:hypothetical protein